MWLWWVRILTRDLTDVTLAIKENYEDDDEDHEDDEDDEDEDEDVWWKKIWW